MKTPYPYQKEHLDIFFSKGITKLPLFWQMRLGKSPLTIWWLLGQNPRPLRVLIVCPKSVLVSWQEELESFKLPHVIFSTNIKTLEIQDGWANVNTHDPNHYPWILTNYECLTAEGIKLHEQPWDAVILDESTKLMNPKTRISRLLTNPEHFPLRNPAYKYDSRLIAAGKDQFRACLAGKPNPESDLNFFQQFKFLYGGMGKYKNYWDFRKQYFYTKGASPGKYIPRPGTSKSISNYINKNAYLLSRKQLDQELPSVYEKRMVALAPQDRKIYDEFEKHWFSDFLQSLLKEGLQGRTPAQVETKFAMQAQSILHQMACGNPKNESINKVYQGEHKLNELTSLLSDELYDEKVVIWCRYINDIEAIQHRIRSLWLRDKVPTQAVKLRGGMITNEIRDVLRRFRANREEAPETATNYMICQVDKAAMGMDLSIADTQIFFSRSWSHLKNDQAKDRLINPKKAQENKGILTLDIIAENTIDEDLYSALIEKKANSAVFKWFLKRTNFNVNLQKIQRQAEKESIGV